MAGLFQNTMEETKELQREWENTKNIRRMHHLFGVKEDEKCKDCEHFYRRKFAKTYFKCELFGLSRGMRTDWRANWTACGEFSRRDDANNV